MENKQNPNPEVTKPTYEELAEALQKLHKQNRELLEAVRQCNLTNMFKRLDYLFKVIENRTAFDSEFLISCIDEIKSTMMGPEESDIDNNTNNEDK